MATLPISISSPAPAPTLFDALRLANSSLNSTSPRSETTTISTPLKDSVSFSKQATQRHISASRQGLDSLNIFTSYVDLLQGQQRAKAMIEQDLTGGSTSTGRASVLNRYQTLQYRQNVSDRMFSLKGDIFQSTLNTTI